MSRIKHYNIGNWGNIRKLYEKTPRPEHLKLRKALARLRWRYKSTVMFYNPYHETKKRPPPNAQWLEVVVLLPNKRMGAIVFALGWGEGGYTSKQQKAFAAKKQFLEAKGIPLLVLSREFSTDEMEIMVYRWGRRQVAAS